MKLQRTQRLYRQTQYYTIIHLHVAEPLEGLRRAGEGRDVVQRREQRVAALAVRLHLRLEGVQRLHGRQSSGLGAGGGRLGDDETRRVLNKLNNNHHHHHQGNKRGATMLPPDMRDQRRTPLRSNRFDGSFPWIIGEPSFVSIALLFTHNATRPLNPTAHSYEGWVTTRRAQLHGVARTLIHVSKQREVAPEP